MMKPDTKSPENRTEPTDFGGIPVEAPLWLLLPKAFSAILISDVLVLLIFWLRFGELTLFAFGFAIFLTALQILIIVGLRFQNRTDLHVTPPAKFDRLDKIGAWWLMACAFGAFFGWICLNLAAGFPAFKLAFHGANIFFSVILPVLTMLPNLRYISLKALYIQIPLLIFITFLPMLVGVSSLLTFWNYFLK